MTWNFDMTEAPKGRTKQVKGVSAKGIETVRDVFVPERFIACSKDGKTVTMTHWLPSQERWNFFATDETPLAWQPWPTHPQSEQSQ